MPSFATAFRRLRTSIDRPAIGCDLKDSRSQERLTSGECTWGASVVAGLAEDGLVGTPSWASTLKPSGAETSPGEVRLRTGAEGRALFCVTASAELASVPSPYG